MTCDINDLKLNGFDFINCESHSNHTGGVCAFIDKKIKTYNVKIIKQQIAWYISFEIVVKKTPITLAGVYLSAKSEHKSLLIHSKIGMNKIMKRNIW